jgi:hypothetical protein
MKHKYQIIFLLLLVSHAISIGQVTQTISLSPAAYKVVRVYTGGSSFRYNQANNYSIGHENISSPYEDDVWRSMYQFDLSSSSIPANAVITSAILQSYVTGNTSIDDGTHYYNQIVKLLSTTVSPATFSRQQIFDRAAVGSQTASHHYTDTAYTPVTNDIIARRTYGKVVYGGSCRYIHNRHFMKKKIINYDDLRKIMVNTQKPPIPILTNEIKLPDNRC